MPFRNKLVLVVDDYEDTLEISRILSANAGCTVRTANNGAGAVAEFSEFSPDVIFLDLAMPGMDGLEITRRLRPLPESEATFIVVVSGYCRPTDKAEALAAGAKYFLSKPADPLALVELSETFASRAKLSRCNRWRTSRERRHERMKIPRPGMLIACAGKRRRINAAARS